ncbi:hypothetical protein HPB48_012481 [Haemaphysalis longicornis]|uniref:Uncharacterized protein n=1 Tax=Haemaphysalis longicornis TaxID=44386 RepID=A0A9J6G6P3_HAELO|nr:hypothetical protein HPB48_012481 [Haemaphysalis longicornis]
MRCSEFSAAAITILEEDWVGMVPPDGIAEQKREFHAKQLAPRMGATFLVRLQKDQQMTTTTTRGGWLFCFFYIVCAQSKFYVQRKNGCIRCKLTINGIMFLNFHFT